MGCCGSRLRWLRRRHGRWREQERPGQADRQEKTQHRHRDQLVPRASGYNIAGKALCSIFIAICGNCAHMALADVACDGI
jgi:hypothetical protein